MPQAQAGGGLVGSAQIVNNEIINDDINSAAAIAGSKLNLADTVQFADLKNTLLKQDTILLSSADLLALHTTPKALIAAPGAGKIIVVKHVLYFYDHGGTTYTQTDGLKCRYVGDTAHLVASLTSGSTGGAGDVIFFSDKGATGVSVVVTAGVNAGVELATNSGTAFLTGDGTLKVFITYNVVTL